MTLFMTRTLESRSLVRIIKSIERCYLYRLKGITKLKRLRESLIGFLRLTTLHDHLFFSTRNANSAAYSYWLETMKQSKFITHSYFNCFSLSLGPGLDVNHVIVYLVGRRTFPRHTCSFPTGMSSSDLVYELERKLRLDPAKKISKGTDSPDPTLCTRPTLTARHKCLASFNFLAREKNQ